ncbi:MAG TPA: DUF4157 domain-containing protein [Longimicrobium sp.]|nr:DUF4157 domain-containing protein [Longimicrobium sp.]
MAKVKTEAASAGRDRQSNSKAAEPAQAGRWAAPRMEAAAPAFAARTLARRVGDQQARRAMAAPPPARPSAPPAPTGRAATPGPRAPSITPAATRAVHRCGCGGACPACRAKEEAAVHRKALPGAPSIGTAAGPAVHRCGCGGTCAACRATEETEVHRKALPGAPSITPAATRAVDRCGCGMREEAVHRQATDGGGSGGYADAVDTRPRGPGRGLDPATRAFMEPRFGRDFGGVRLHTGPEAARSARGLDARAFTIGQDIYFGQGEYSPGTQGGRRLLAHELTHTVQQSGAAPAPQTALRVSRPGDALELEAERVAARVVDGTGAGSVSSAGRGVQRQETSFLDDVETAAGEAWEDVTEAAGEAWEGVTTTAEEVVSEGADELMGIASSVRDAANALAAGLGGSVSVSGLSLVITVPPMAVGSASFRFRLSEIGQDLPLPPLIVPLTPVVSLYGMPGLHAGLTPELSAQVGPAVLHGLTIVIGPGGFAASGAVTAAAAVALGAEVRVGVFGEVGILITWPDPPFVITIPVARIDAGLAGFARGTAVAQLTVGGAMTGGLGGFALSADALLDLGLAADLGVAGFGALSILGMDACRVYWPLWSWQDQMTLSTSASLDLAAGPGGAAMRLAVATPVLGAVPFSSLPLDLQRTIFTDACPMCDVFRTLRLMPSQQSGGKWTGHPTPPLPGPIPDVYELAPAVRHPAKCRGACGPDCKTCRSLGNPIECEATPDGNHVLWQYTNLTECDSHEGCRQHDEGYDWCLRKGESSIYGPCHRLPDFECLCSYDAPRCVGWISGRPPHDLTMLFAERVEPIASGAGPCPATSGPGPGPGTWPGTSGPGALPPGTGPNTTGPSITGPNPPGQAPDGVSEPIPMIWYKPLGGYRNPIWLSGERFYRDKRRRLLGHNRWIGVPFWPDVGTVLTRNQTPRGNVAREFMNTIVDEGFEYEDEYSPDHVQDLMFSGADDFSNLWPLQRDINGPAGPCHQLQPVWYSNPGDPTPVQGSIQYLHGRKFRIIAIRDPRLGCQKMGS